MDDNRALVRRAFERLDFAHRWQSLSSRDSRVETCNNPRDFLLLALLDGARLVLSVLSFIFIPSPFASPTKSVYVTLRPRREKCLREFVARKLHSRI